MKMMKDLNRNVDRIKGKITEKTKSVKRDHISGIYCQATDCIYHDPKSRCAADRITVASNNDPAGGGTSCETFRCRQ